MMRPVSIGRSTLLNLSGLGIPLLVALAATPAVIRGLGTERFGILALAWTLLTYFTVFDLGLGRAATKLVAEAIGGGRRDQAPSVLVSALLVQAALGGIGGVLMVFGAPWMVERVLRVAAEHVEEAVAAYRVLGLALPFVLMTGSLRGALEAAQRFDLSNLIRIPLNAANFLLPLVGIWLGLDLPGIVALLALAAAAGCAVYAVVVARLFPGTRAQAHIDPATLRRLISFGGWVMVSSAAGPFLVYLERFIIGAVVGMAAVAYYTAPFEIVSRILIIPSSLVAVLFPVFAAAGADSGARERAVLVPRAIKYLILTVGLCVVMIEGLAADALHWWLGPVFAAEGATALRLLAIGVLVNSVASVPYSLLHGLGRPDVAARFHLLELPIHAGVSWLLVSRWGVEGAAAAWTIRVSLDAMLLLWAGGRYGRLPLRAAFSGGAARAAGFVLAGCTAAALVSLGGTVERMALTVLITVSVAGAAWRWVLDDADRQRARRLVSWYAP